MLEWVKDHLPKPIGALLVALAGKEVVLGPVFGGALKRGFESSLKDRGLSLEFQQFHLLKSKTTGWVLFDIPKGVIDSLEEASRSEFVQLFVLAAGFIALMAHVLVKKPLSETPPEERPQNRCATLYCRGYFYLTFLLFLTLTLSVLFGTDKPWSLIALFLTLQVPVIVYLVLYPKDVAAGAFGERFTYLALVSFCLLTLLLLPYQYGKRFFDLKGDVVTKADGRPLLEDGQMTLLLDSENKIVGTVKLKESEVFVTLQQVTTVDLETEKRRLREIVDSLSSAPEEQVDDPEAAVAEALGIS